MYFQLASSVFKKKSRLLYELFFFSYLISNWSGTDIEMSFYNQICLIMLAEASSVLWMSFFRITGEIPLLGISLVPLEISR